MFDRMTQIEPGIAIDSLFKELADPPTCVNAENGSHRMVDWARSRERRRCNPDYCRNLYEGPGANVLMPTRRGFVPIENCKDGDCYSGAQQDGTEAFPSNVRNRRCDGGEREGNGQTVPKEVVERRRPMIKTRPETDENERKPNCEVQSRRTTDQTAARAQNAGDSGHDKGNAGDDIDERAEFDVSHRERFRAQQRTQNQL